MNEDIRKIVELEIDLDQLELEEMGVEVVSFVNEPAIEVDFMAFSKEKFVEPKSGESEDEFIQRCMPVVTGEGYDNDQALAICYSYYEGSYDPSQLTPYIDQDDELRRKEFDGLDDACWTGYEPIGLKPGRGGRMVPNCVPIENEKFYQIDIDGKPAFSSKEEAIERSKDFGCEGYHEHMVNGMVFYMPCTTHDFQFSYDDYPQVVKDNAARGIRYNEEIDNKCATQVGKVRAQQLANGEKISVDTINRMISYLSRAEQWYDADDKEACGTISYLLWGGKEALTWAKKKMRQIEEEMVLSWAKEYGEQITEEYTSIDPNAEFSTVGDITKAIQGLDILGKLGIRKDEPAEIKYKYTGPNAERGFCKAMMALNKLYSDADMATLRSQLGSINPGMGPRGRNSYSVFDYKGGVNCRHYWTKNALFKPEGSRRVLMIDQGPAEGNAGKSNNSNQPSPSGSVSNNASLRFSFSVMDDEKRIVAGPLMVPNKFILRRDENGEPYYVFFSKDTIKRIQERFNKQQRQNVTDVDHDGNILTDNILLEQWIIESRVHDKSRYYGYDNLPTGSWFGVYKVNDDKVWDRIKNGELRGFSIAGDFINKAKPVENTSEGLLSKIANILNNINE